MAWDSSRGVIVLFGGSTSVAGKQNDTWEWNGTRWIRVSLEGPLPRTAHSMAYDSVRGVTVLFGGQDASSNPLGDTWEWDGTTWNQRANWTGQQGQPQPRWGHALAFDPARGVIVMFGGQTTNSRFGSTWEWNGTAWILRSETGPFPRFDHAMCWHAGLQRVVLFGGNNLTDDLNDLWQWDGAVWTPLGAVNPPPARRNHAMVYDSVRERLVMFGGRRTSPQLRLGDTWEWFSGEWEQRLAGVPGDAIEGHAMAFDEARGDTVLFGGRVSNGELSGPTWGLSDQPWLVLRLTGQVPPARYGHVMGYDSVRGVTVLFGGRTSSPPLHHPLRDLWEWEGTDTWVQRTTLDGPEGGDGYAWAFDNDRGVFVLFGNNRPETWEWNGTEWTLRKVISPPARWGPGMTYDSIRRRVVLWGGSIGGWTADLWEFDGLAWSQPTYQVGPSGYDYPFLVFDQIRAVALLLTRNNQPGWSWNGVSWSNPCCIYADIYKCGAYDPFRGVTYIYPHSGSRVNEWDGQTTYFASDPQTGPGHRFFANLAFDTNRRRLVLFGGLHSDSRTWEYRVIQQPTVVTPPMNRSVPSGSSVSFTVTAAGTDPFVYQWRRNGQKLASDSRITGTNSHVLSLNPALLDDAGNYDCLISNTCGSITSASALLTITCPLQITQHPQTTTVYRGGSITFSAAATGLEPIEFQWRFGEDDLIDGPHVIGSSTSNLTVTGAAAVHQGMYSVRVTNSCASGLSNSAMLTVQSPCIGDADRSGDVNFADITSVLTNWANTYGQPAGTGPGDASLDGLVNFIDITTVLTQWGALCAPD